MQRFAERAVKGTVAVAVDGKALKMLPDCRLPGSYTEVRTQPGQGRLWATNRPLLLTSEVKGGACAEATHLVAAFARARSGSLTFSGVLIPLPCPSVGNGEPARGCIGRGLTGPLRRARAELLITKLKATPVDRVALTEFLEVYAIAPDDGLVLGLMNAAHVNTECALYSHAHWAAAQYRTTRSPSGDEVTTFWPDDDPVRALVETPTLDVMLSDRSCLHHPMFRKCFSGIAEPVDEPWRCWEPGPATVAAPAQTRAPTPNTPAKPPAAVTRP